MQVAELRSGYSKVVVDLEQKHHNPFAASDYRRFSDREIDEHFKGWIPGMKDRFAKEKDRLKELQKGYREQNWWIKP